MTEQDLSPEVKELSRTPVYDAFVKYGLYGVKVDADILVSTDKTGTWQGLGKYLAILDNCKPEDERYNDARNCVYKYLDAYDAFVADITEKQKVRELKSELEKIIGREQ